MVLKVRANTLGSFNNVSYDINSMDKGFTGRHNYCIKERFLSEIFFPKKFPYSLSRTKHFINSYYSTIYLRVGIGLKEQQYFDQLVYGFAATVVFGNDFNINLQRP